LGYRDRDEWVTAVAVADGKQLWSSRIGPAVKEAGVMRWLSQRTPTVDNDLLYALTARGELVCLETATGRERWRRDYVKDFNGQPGPFGYCDYPLVVGDKLICVPGGSVIAINRKTGEFHWKTPVVDGRAAYGVTVAAGIERKRHYVACFEKTLVGIDE